MSEPNKPFLQRKSTIFGAVGAFALLIVVMTLASGPTPSAHQPGSPSDSASAGLGTAGQTSAFNQTFAQRLREEQSQQTARIERELKEQMEARLAASAAAMQADAARQVQALQQQINDLEGQRPQAGEPAPLSSARPHQFKAPGVSMQDAPAGVRPVSTIDGNGEAATVAPPAASSKPVIPPNGFVAGRLLNGVVASIGDSPTAFLVALEGMYKAANGYTVNLNGCMATVEGRANLGAGRIEGKPAEITCNFPQDGRVQTWQISGWIVDQEDGIRGLRAQIVDNTGKKIAASALATALGGAGTALNAKQFTTNSGTGGSSSSFTGNATDAMTGAALAGAGSGAAAAINEHFALYRPTLQKGGGTRVTLVIANELSVPPAGAHITNNTASNERKLP